MSTRTIDVDSVEFATAILEAPSEPILAPVGSHLPRMHRGISQRATEVLAVATGVGMITIAIALALFIRVALHGN